MSTLVRDVVIVGGGSAGWLTALHLKWALGPDSSITLIESPNVPTIGVGEGTQPELRAFLERTGIDVEEVMKATGASYKNGIRFTGWRTPDQSDHYYHPFFSGNPADRGSATDPMLCWDRLRVEGLPSGKPLPPLPEACWRETSLIKAKKAPVAFKDGQRVPQDLGNYALHMDAARLGIHLATLAALRGIRHIRDDVTDAILDPASPTPRITAVATKEHGQIEGQLFIDCTGFRRLLISKAAPDNDFVDFKDHLLNDRAITCRIDWAGDKPESPQGGIESCTVSTALSAGWVWEVPLYERAGTGYVYSSRFISDDDAEAEFLSFLKRKGYQPESTGRLKFQTGHLRRSWVGNCVTVGLSSGFIEPLEATGIALITYQARRLVELWPTTDFCPVLSDQYNDIMRRSYEWTRDFIVMHFCLSPRRDSDYWKHVTSDEAIPDSVRETLALYHEHWPFGEAAGADPRYRLPTESMACVLAAFDRFPEARCPLVAARPLADVEATLRELRAKSKPAVDAALQHDNWLMILNNHPEAKVPGGKKPAGVRTKPTFAAPTMFGTP